MRGSSTVVKCTSSRYIFFPGVKSERSSCEPESWKETTGIEHTKVDGLTTKIPLLSWPFECSLSLSVDKGDPLPNDTSMSQDWIFS